MKVEIFAKDVELTPELKKYIEKKTESFEKVLGKSNEERKFDFRIGRNTKAHQKGKIFFAEGRVETPNKAYGGKVKGGTESEVIDKLKDEILKKIRRNKDKKDSLIKRGGRKIKELLRRN